MRAAAVAPDTAGCLYPSSSSKATESKPPWKTVRSRQSCKTPNLQTPGSSPPNAAECRIFGVSKVSNSECLSDCGAAIARRKVSGRQIGRSIGRILLSRTSEENMVGWSASHPKEKRMFGRESCPDKLKLHT